MKMGDVIQLRLCSGHLPVPNSYWKELLCIGLFSETF
jgi:hypothetical protein